MEMWYYIKENGTTKRVDHETYKAFDGEKYYTPCMPGLRIAMGMLIGYRYGK